MFCIIIAYGITREEKLCQIHIQHFINYEPTKRRVLSANQMMHQDVWFFSCSLLAACLPMRMPGCRFMMNSFQFEDLCLYRRLPSTRTALP